MAVSAAEIAPKAFRALVAEGGERQDVEDDLQVRRNLGDHSVAHSLALMGSDNIC